MPPPLLLGSGKRPNELAVAAISSSCALLAVSDTNSNREFLIDTGAEISLIPASSTDKAGYIRLHSEQLMGRPFDLLDQPT